MKTLLLVPSQMEREGLACRGAVLCGVGLLQAALLTQAALASGRYDACLLVGLAGTRDRRQAPPGTIVVGSAVRNEAVGAGHGAHFRGLSEMGLPVDSLPPESIPLVDRASAPGPRGVIGSVAAASAGLREASAWRRRHPDVLVEEMEGYAVALACARAGVPLSIVRAVSNIAGDRDKRRWRIGQALRALRAVLP